MVKKEKKSGKERREYILELLKKNTKPLTGQVLADKTAVSRQVIVTDVALLRTANEPIISTNNGYLYLKEDQSKKMYLRIVACDHPPEQTKK